MPFEAQDLSVIQAALDEIVGHSIWGSALGEGSFLTLEIGKQVLPIAPKAKSHGEWHLWIYCSAWRLEKGGSVVVASEDAREELSKALPTSLDGRKIAGARVTALGVDLEVTLEDQTVLRTFAIFSSGYEHWMLFRPDGKVLTLGPGVAYALSPVTGNPVTPA